MTAGQRTFEDALNGPPISPLQPIIEHRDEVIQAHQDKGQTSISLPLPALDVLAPVAELEAAVTTNHPEQSDPFGVSLSTKSSAWERAFNPSPRSLSTGFPDALGHTTATPHNSEIEEPYPSLLARAYERSKLIGDLALNKVVRGILSPARRTYERTERRIANIGYLAITKLSSRTHSIPEEAQHGDPDTRKSRIHKICVIVGALTVAGVAVKFSWEHTPTVNHATLTNIVPLPGVHHTEHASRVLSDHSAVHTGGSPVVTKIGQGDLPKTGLANQPDMGSKHHHITRFVTGRLGYSGDTMDREISTFEPKGLTIDQHNQLVAEIVKENNVADPTHLNVGYKFKIRKALLNLHSVFWTKA